MGLLSPVTGKLFDKIGGRILSIMGMLTIMIGALLMAQFSQNTTQLCDYFIFSYHVR